jgi:protein TonB
MRMLATIAAGALALAMPGAPASAAAQAHRGAGQPPPSRPPAPPAPPPYPLSIPGTATPPLFISPNPDVELQRHLRSRRPQQARLRAGFISDDDYPAAALRIEAEGRVTMRFLIGTSGRVMRCDIVESSGNADLDNVSCALVTRRFVYFPAIGSNRRVTTEWRTQRILWRLPDPEPEPAATSY